MNSDWETLNYQHSEWGLWHTQDIQIWGLNGQKRWQIWTREGVLRIMCTWVMRCPQRLSGEERAQVAWGLPAYKDQVQEKVEVQESTEEEEVRRAKGSALGILLRGRVRQNWNAGVWISYGLGSRLTSGKMVFMPAWWELESSWKMRW